MTESEKGRARRLAKEAAEAKRRDKAQRMLEKHDAMIAKRKKEKKK